MDMLQKAENLMSQVAGHEEFTDDYIKGAAVYAQIAIARELRALNGLLKAHWGYFGGEESAPDEPPSDNASDNASADNPYLLDEDEIQRMLRF